MQLLKKFKTEAEAQVALGLLENEGILGVVDGANAQTALSTPILALVRLMVHEDDLLKARVVLRDADELPDVPLWICGQCGKEVDAGFAVCWNCGAEYAANHIDGES